VIDEVDWQQRYGKEIGGHLNAIDMASMLETARSLFRTFAEVAARKGWSDELVKLGHRLAEDRRRHTFYNR